MAGFFTVNKAFGLNQSPVLSWLLFTTILLVYWVDHLIDLHKYGIHLSERHQQISRNKNTMYVACLLLAVVAVVIALYYLSFTELFVGCVLVFLSICYLLLHHFRFVPKEPFAAGVYAASICFQVLLKPDFWTLMALFYFFGLTLYSMYGIAQIEKDKDKQYGVPNSHLSPKNFYLFFKLLIVFGIVLLLCSPNDAFKQLIVADLMLLMILFIIIELYSNKANQSYFYRITIEWSFLLPWIWV